MLRNRDYVYYDYRFENKKPKKLLWKAYCILRKFITVYESPSKVLIWDLKRHFIGDFNG